MMTIGAAILRDILNFVNKHRRGVAEALVILVLVFFAYHKGHTPTPTVKPTSGVTTTVTQTPTGPITTVQTEKASIDTKTAIQYVTDPKDKAIIDQLLAENKQLKVLVTSLTSSVATYQAHGGGAVEPQPIPESSTVAAVEPQPLHFKDFRLDFRSDGRQASYDLTQKFEILTTTGRKPDGNGFSDVKLYEIGKDGERLPVTDTQTTAVFAAPNAPRWFVSPAIHAGLAVGHPDTVTDQAGVIVGVQWLKRGSTKAAGDTKLALLTPVVFLSNNTKEIGILPVSWNIGQLKHSPFQNLWVSPYLGTDTVTQPKLTRIGFALTATF
jgi:hypothetical protein